MSTFVTMPSGLRVNTAHIAHFMEPVNMNGKTVISLSCGDPSTITEDMTSLELDQLLQPQSAVITESVVNLDRLKVGAGCQFTHGDTMRHGIIENISGCGELFISSKGDSFVWDPADESITLQ